MVNAILDVAADAFEVVARTLFLRHCFIPFLTNIGAVNKIPQKYYIQNRIFYSSMKRKGDTMAIYTMGDLHLSTNSHTNKSMEVFGKRWQGYTEKLKRNWESVVLPTDTVVIPGDISWAMKLEEALSDFHFIESLPGQKLIGKGNHDFWWMTAKKMNDFFSENGLTSIRILNNNAYLVEGQVLCGTRGWFMDERQQVVVGDVDYDKIIHREVIRLRLSLDEGKRLQKEATDLTGITPRVSVFLHFPPVWMDFVCRPFVDVLHEYGDPDCYFGHIHGMYSVPAAFDFEGIHMRLVSSDALDFHLYRLSM